MSIYSGFLAARSLKLASVRAVFWFGFLVCSVSFAMIVEFGVGFGFGFGFGFGIVFSLFFEISDERTSGSETDFD